MPKNYYLQTIMIGNFYWITTAKELHTMKSFGSITLIGALQFVVDEAIYGKSFF
jgi:hypothetical protein